MPVVKLTPTFISKLRAPHPDGKQVLWFDTETRGFGVQVSGTTPAIDYVAQRDLPNKIKGAKKRSRRVNIGPVNSKSLSLEVARERAEEALDQIRRGIDPKAKADPAVMYTLRQARELYFAVKKLSDGSKRIYRHHVDKHLADWLELPLCDITPEMVETRHAEIARKIAAGERYSGQTSANDAMNTLGILWRFAARRIELGPCPTDRLQDEDAWFPKARRKKRVTPEALPAFFVAVNALENRTSRDLLLVLLFTGFRVTETKKLKWKDIDLTGRTVTLVAPNVKSRKEVELPMSDFVHELLVARRALGLKSEFVFPGVGASGHVSDTQRAFARVADASGIAVSPHPLRRTFLKVGAAARIHPVWLKVLCNHALPPGVDAEHYLDPEIADLRAPAQQMADQILRLCDARPVAGANVAKLR